MIRPHAYLPHGTPGLFLAVCMVGYPWFILGSLYGWLPLVYSWQFVCLGNNNNNNQLYFKRIT